MNRFLGFSNSRNPRPIWKGCQRGYSSVGRALPLQGRCQRFDSAYLQPFAFLILFFTSKKKTFVLNIIQKQKQIPIAKGILDFNFEIQELNSGTRILDQDKRWCREEVWDSWISSLEWFCDFGQIKEGWRWRPRHSETMKGADTGETLRGAGNKLWSEDPRIGQPLELPNEFIVRKETTRWIETS